MTRNIFLICVLLLAGVVLIPIGFVMWLITKPFDKKGVVMLYISKIWSFLLIDMNPMWRVEISGVENIDPKKGYVIISNHQTMLDIPLLYHLPKNLIWVSKQEVLKVPIVGWVLWMQNGITIKRGETNSGKDMIRKGSEALERGVSVMIFPEGTRSKTGRVNDFLPGAFLLAAKAPSAILPVVINGTFEKQKGRKLFTIEVLPEVPLERVTSTGIKALSAEMNDLIREEHKKIAPQLYN